MGAFIGIGIIGFMFFAFSAVFGHHDFGHGHDVSHDHGGGHDGHESGPSAFSIFCIAWTMMGFGAVGAFARYFSFSPPASTGYAALAGGLLWVLTFQVMKWMHGQQGDSLVTNAQLINQTGRLTIPIVNGGLGKMSVSLAGATELIVTADHDIPVGALVRVKSSSGSTYHVEPVQSDK